MPKNTPQKKKKPRDSISELFFKKYPEWSAKVHPGCFNCLCQNTGWTLLKPKKKHPKVKNRCVVRCKFILQSFIESMNTIN
ncbi:conserved domain protein [delta proteobacterium NaphS2]|nr:conserved domain protein [delta proteobacterium NaphS2]